MLTTPRSRFAYVLIVLPALLAVVGLAVLVLRQAWAAGMAEAWMMAGVLAVVVGLPLAMVLLPVANWLRRRAKAWATIPHAGENVPRVGL